MPGRGRSAGRLAKKEEEENWGQTEGAWRTLRREERSERTAVVGCVGCLSRDCLGEEGCEGEACDGKQHDHLRKQRKRGREGGKERAGRQGERRMVETAAYVSQTRACLSTLDYTFSHSQHDPVLSRCPRCTSQDATHRISSKSVHGPCSPDPHLP